MNLPKIFRNNPIEFSARWGCAAICAIPLFIAGASMQSHSQNSAYLSRVSERSPYIVDGLGLGDPVAPQSSVYREYRCRPSEQFASFIWCQRHKVENGKFGQFSSVTSILHSTAGATAYVSRYIEPAFFGPGDVKQEIERLSRRFGLDPRILRPPAQLKNQSAVIAYWGEVTLEPLDEQSLAEIASGYNVRKEMLFDFLGDFGRSASENLPIFQLGGGEGYVWGARFDENGVGALRMTAIDANDFDSSVDTGRSVGRSGAEADTPAPAQKPSVVWSSGSGFFVSDEGDVPTNNHVVDNCTSIRVSMDQTRPVEAHVVARDSTNDLALLSTRLTPRLIAAPRSGLRLGEPVAAFGYPHTDILATSGNFTLGNVTALAGIGDDSRYLQMSAPVQGGNSGGPLLDQSGNLIGVVTAKLNAVKIQQDSGDLPQNVNFALKASVAASFLDSNHVKYVIGSATSPLKPEDLADQARSLSVFIKCR